jgi:predicted transposase/invertase (TIGR01784 family)
VVDVKARDAASRLFQVEVQLLAWPDLPARILYGWADLYAAQLDKGEDYAELKPTYAVWLLEATLLVDRPGYAQYP